MVSTFQSAGGRFKFDIPLLDNISINIADYRVNFSIHHYVDIIVSVICLKFTSILNLNITLFAF